MVKIIDYLIQREHSANEEKTRNVSEPGRMQPGEGHNPVLRPVFRALNSLMKRSFLWTLIAHSCLHKPRSRLHLKKGFPCYLMWLLSPAEGTTFHQPGGNAPDCQHRDSPQESRNNRAKETKRGIGKQEVYHQPRKKCTGEANRDHPCNPKVWEGDFYESGRQEASNQTNDQPHQPAGC